MGSAENPPPASPASGAEPTTGPLPSESAPEPQPVPSSPPSREPAAEPDAAETTQPEDSPRPSARRRREERQQRARRAQLAQLPRKVLVQGGIAIAVVAVIGGAWWGFQYLPEAAQDVHWHAAFEIYANGEHLSFMNQAYDLGPPAQYGYGTGYMRAHLHVTGSSGTDDVVHIEGLSGLDCQTWLDHGLVAKMSNSALRLNGPPYSGRTYENNATHSWKLYVQHAAKTEWDLVSKKTSYEPQQHDRLLFTFGNETKEQLEAQFASVLPESQIPL